MRHRPEYSNLTCGYQRWLLQLRSFGSSGRVLSRSGSEGCAIVTIERHSSDRLSAGPLYMRIYARSTRTGLASLGSSCCTESIIVFTPTPPEPPRFEPRLKFWRTTAPSFGEAQRMDASEQLSTLFLSIWKTKSG
jgi:hypothetical protein